MVDFLGRSHNLRKTLGWGMVHGRRKGKWGKAMEHYIFGESVVEKRPHLYKRLTVNGAITERDESIVNLCFRE